MEYDPSNFTPVCGKMPHLIVADFPNESGEWRAERGLRGVGNN
jgi:hypothetical protein